MRKRTKIGLVLAFVTAVEAAVFGHYNAVLGGSAGAGTPSVNTNAVNLVSLGNLPLPKSTTTPLIAVTADGQMLAYIDPSNVLHVEDLSTHKQTYHLQLEYTPIYLQWIDDQSLFIGTQYVSGSTKDLRLSTINVSSGTVRLIQMFSGMATTAMFQRIAYSNYTNDVYVLIGDDYASILYHFDTNGNMNTVDVGGRFLSNIALSQTNDTLFFQDFAEGTPNVLQESTSGNIQLIERNSAILRVRSNTLYFGRLNTQGDVTAVDSVTNGKVTTVATLSLPTAADNVFVNEYGHVFVLSPSGILDPKGNHIGDLPSGSRIFGTGEAFFALSDKEVKAGL